MRFDRPAALGSGSDERQGDLVIDSESRELLQKLYPKPYGVYSRGLAAFQVSGWRSGIGLPAAQQWLSTTETANTITGLCQLDMGLNGNFRINSSVQNVQRRSGFEVVLGSWANTHLIDVSCSILSFHEEDQRIQTGRVEYVHIKPNSDNNPGQSLSTNVRFSKPFNKPPNVVTFISGLDTINGKYIRIDLNPSNIDRFGFRLNMRTWADTTVYNIQASWLAHEPDEWTIRSGTFDRPSYPSWMREDRSRQTYTSAMRRKPQAMFCAFSHIDVHPDHNIRLCFETPDWNEREVEGRFYTWEEESKFFCLKGCYVAVL